MKAIVEVLIQTLLPTIGHIISHVTYKLVVNLRTPLEYSYCIFFHFYEPTDNLFSNKETLCIGLINKYNMLIYYVDHSMFRNGYSEDLWVVYWRISDYPSQLDDDNFLTWIITHNQDDL